MKKNQIMKNFRKASHILPLDQGTQRQKMRPLDMANIEGLLEDNLTNLNRKKQKPSTPKKPDKDGPKLPNPSTPYGNPRVTTNYHEINIDELLKRKKRKIPLGGRKSNE